MPEWSRGSPAKRVCIARTGSNPVGVDERLVKFFFYECVRVRSSAPARGPAGLVWVSVGIVVGWMAERSKALV